MCPGRSETYAIWVRFGDNSPAYYPTGINTHYRQANDAIDAAEKYLACQNQPCKVSVYRYVWDQTNERNAAFLVWDDSNYEG